MLGSRPSVDADTREEHDSPMGGEQARCSPREEEGRRVQWWGAGTDGMQSGAVGDPVAGADLGVAG